MRELWREMEEGKEGMLLRSDEREEERCFLEMSSHSGSDVLYKHCMEKAFFYLLQTET